MHQLHNRLLLFLFQSAPVVLLFLPTLEVAAAEQAQIAFVSNSSSSGTTLTHDASDGLSGNSLAHSNSNGAEVSAGMRNSMALDRQI